MIRRLLLSAALSVFLAASLRASPSYYRSAPVDAAAVVLRPGAFGAVGDGVADDTAAVQAAINDLQSRTVRGVVLVERARYRLTATVHVWAGIRLIGYGAERPAFVLGAATSGYASGEGRYLLHFVAARPAAGEPLRDANPGTFYSGLSNIDLEIGADNPAAVGVRAHWAQHGFIAHVTFRLTSGLAGVQEVGNEIDDCEFIGGDYGILTHKPSPSWPFALLDTSFTGQRFAAIRTQEAGMTIVRAQFRDVPTAVLVDLERSEALFIRDSRFEHLSGPAVIVSEDANARTQVNLQNIACAGVPVLVRLRESGREFTAPADATSYVVQQFSHGLHLADLGTRPERRSVYAANPVQALPAPVPSDVPPVPDVATWCNVRDAGARGDDTTDDTGAIQAAITGHRVVYFPAGRYRVSEPLRLRADSVLVGLNPIAAQIALADHSPAFRGENADRRDPAERNRWEAHFPLAQGTGAPQGLIETTRGGGAMIVGLGLDPGDNPRAVAALWRAGADSLVDDVRFLGGHGTYLPDGSTVPVYNESHTGDANPPRPWGAQYASLWVTDGGGGTFKNIWTPSPYATAGMIVSDTSTSGRVYALSSEHHVRNEVIVRRAANWSFHALQFEEERLEGPDTQPLEITASENLLFANTYLYRVMSTYSPHPQGVLLTDSRDLRFRGVHTYSPSKFTVDATLRDPVLGVAVNAREIAWLDVSGDRPAAEAVSAAGPIVTRVADGFNNLDALVADAAGNVLFVDARWQRIFRWDATSGHVRLLRDEPLEPVALAVAQDGTVLVVTRVGTVYAFDPDRPDQPITPLQPQAAAPRPGATAWVPLNRWRDAHDFLERTTAAAAWHYVSPDGSIFIPADDAFLQAGSYRSYYSTIDLIRSYGLGPVIAGRPMAVADEFGQKTYLFATHDAAGGLAAPRLLAEEGEAAVVTGPDGNLYVAAGDVIIYAPDGQELSRITLPRRPTSLAFGGPDGRTLLVGARDTLYAVAQPWPQAL